MKHKKLQLDELNFVQSELNYKKKSVLGSYVLGMFLGPLGIHRAYLGRTWSGLLRAVTTFATIGVGAIVLILEANWQPKDIEISSSIFGLLFIALIGLSLLWQIADLLLIPGWLREMDDTNEEIAVEKAIQSRYVEEHLLKREITDSIFSLVNTDIKTLFEKQHQLEQENERLRAELVKLPVPDEKIIDSIELEKVDEPAEESTDLIESKAEDIQAKPLESEDLNKEIEPTDETSKEVEVVNKVSDEIHITHENDELGKDLVGDEGEKLEDKVSATDSEIVLHSEEKVADKVNNINQSRKKKKKSKKSRRENKYKYKASPINKSNYKKR